MLESYRAVKSMLFALEYGFILGEIISILMRKEILLTEIELLTMFGPWEI